MTLDDRPILSDGCPMLSDDRPMLSDGCPMTITADQITYICEEIVKTH